MITININKNDKNEIVSFQINGHAGYDKKGKDIVCAGVSAVTNMVIIGMEKLQINLKYEVGESGFISLELPANIESRTMEKLQFLLNCMELEFMDIEKSYGQYIKVICHK